MTPDERAKKVAEALWAQDGASAWIGMTIEAVSEGRAVLSMTVEKHHSNGHGICHGGVIFALADSAFAFACNSRNVSTVAQHNSITYIAPGQLGDDLIADAREVALQGRTGIYDVTVRTAAGVLIAEFRGSSRAIGGTVFEEDT
ncbi:MAG: hydroxyphenylacetyl-CoA thioesterase PaaI [Pseudomonadota bacterium]